MPCACSYDEGITMKMSWGFHPLCFLHQSWLYQSTCWCVETWIFSLYHRKDSYPYCKQHHATIRSLSSKESWHRLQMVQANQLLDWWTLCRCAEMVEDPRLLWIDSFQKEKQARKHLHTNLVLDWGIIAGVYGAVNGRRVDSNPVAFLWIADPTPRHIDPGTRRFQYSRVHSQHNVMVWAKKSAGYQISLATTLPFRLSSSYMDILLYSYRRSVLRFSPHRSRTLTAAKSLLCRLTHLHRRFVVPKTVQKIEVYVAQDMA